MKAPALSRRRLVAGLAAVSALPAAAVASTGPDAALLALKARWEAADLAFQQACRRSAALSHATKVPDLPDAVFLQNGDRHLGLHRYSRTRHDGRRWYPVEPPDAEIRYLRRRFFQAEDVPLVASKPDGDVLRRQVPWPEAQARADQIVSAWDAWQEACETAYVASGYRAARIECERSGAALSALDNEMRAATPRTLAGLLAVVDFAQRVLNESSDEDDLGAMLARAVAGVREGLPCA